MMPAATNEFARLAGRAEGLAPVGGSDAHTLEGVAHAFTTVPERMTGRSSSRASAPDSPCPRAAPGVTRG